MTLRWEVFVRMNYNFGVVESSELRVMNYSDVSERALNDALSADGNVESTELSASELMVT